MRRGLAAMASLLVLAACQSSSTASTGPTFVGATLPACSDDSSWRCGTVTVPLDRSQPSARMITVAFYVQSRIDHTHPALEPVLTSGGGPGGSIWFQRHGIQRRTWHSRHDTVLVERRGVGRSGGINCSALQDGVDKGDDVLNATSACAAQLGQAADSYGSVDVALDIEAVRQALGITSFDIYGASYVSLAAQAYVARFPSHVHALIFDSGISATDALALVYATEYVAPTIRVLNLLCSRSPDCATAHPHPDQVLDQAIARLHRGGPVSALDAWGLTNNLGPAPDGLQAKDYLDALAALVAGRPAQLEALVKSSGGFGGNDPNEFNNGDNVASTCADIAPLVPWAAADSFSTRLGKLEAALEQLDPVSYAPLVLKDLESAAAQQLCLAWPMDAGEPMVPKNATFPLDLPVLVMGGDIDLQQPIEINKVLLQEFPQAAFVEVAGAGHVSSDPGWRTCGDQVVTPFLETLQANASACS